MRRRSKIRRIGSLALGAAVAVIALAAGAAGVGIERVAIQSGLRYVSTAVWLGDDLIALDLPTNSFRRIGRDGEVTEVYRLEDVIMMAVGPLPGRTDEFLVKLNQPEEWQSVKLGEGKSWSLEPSWSCEDCATSGVNWAALNRDRILAAGNVKKGGEWGEEGTRSTSGIFWISPEGPELALELPEAALPLYFGTQPYVAVAGGKGYAMVPENLEEGTGWLEVIELEPYNRSVRTVTRLPARMPPMTWMDQESIVEAMRAVSEQRIPVALLGWQDRLFMVDHEYEGYLVWEIEPATGQMRFLDSIEGGDFITIVPGRGSWAVIEKGPVVDFGRQAFQAFSLYPAERFERLLGG